MSAGVMEATKELLFNGRPPRNVFELEAARIHAAQPVPLSVVFVVPATDRGRARHQQYLANRETLHAERWQKFRKRLSVKFPAIAETTAMFHVIEFWECWLCGFDAYKSNTFAWWRCLHFDIRHRIIRLSRKHGRDQLNRRWLIKKAMSEQEFPVSRN